MSSSANNQTFKVQCEARVATSGKKKFTGLLDFYVGKLEFSPGPWIVVSKDMTLLQSSRMDPHFSATLRPYAHQKPVGYPFDPTVGADPSVGGIVQVNLRNIRIYLPE